MSPPSIIQNCALLSRLHSSSMITAFFLDVMLHTRILTAGNLQNITTSTKLHAMTPHTPYYHVNLHSNLTHVKFIFYVTERGTSLLNDLLKVTR